MKIDFVIPWVDGADIKWQLQKELHTGNAVDVNDVRYRDWGILKYWFRAVEQFAPWVNCIYFVTCGQIPDWLNVEHPKLKLVDHKEYLPDEYLPTFSSHPIELNFHRICGLSEHFVYFNDDMFLNAPVSEGDFFYNGFPRLTAILSELSPSVINDTFLHCLCNNIAFMNKHFRKRNVIWKNSLKWFSGKYGKLVLKNIYYSVAGNAFSMIQNFHMPSPMLKSTYEKVWNMEPELLHETSCHKIRNHKDVNQYVMNYYDIGTGQFVPRNPKDGHYYEVGHNSKALCDDIIKGGHKMICINDAVCSNFELEMQRIILAFEKKYPMKSSYEV